MLLISSDINVAYNQKYKLIIQKNDMRAMGAPSHLFFKELPTAQAASDLRAPVLVPNITSTYALHVRAQFDTVPLISTSSPRYRVIRIWRLTLK